MVRGKAPILIDLPLPLELRSKKKQESIYRALREAILTGMLAKGNPLPSTRSLAQRWQVARGTVEAAFDRLRMEGYVTRKAGSGTVVSAMVPDKLIAAETPSTTWRQYRQQPPATPLATARPPSSSKAKHQDKSTSLHSVSRLNGSPRENTGQKKKESERHRDTSPDTTVRSGIPFIARLADPSLFRIESWAKLTARTLRETTPDHLVTADTRGLATLRSWVANYLRSFRGIPCDDNDIIITTGIRHASTLIVRTLLNPEDTICLEDPGYTGIRRIAEAHGIRPVSVPVDEEGLITDVLDNAPMSTIHSRLIYVTPAHQAPLGVTMSVQRRLALLEWAAAHHAYIIEDDYDSEFNYNVSPLPALKSIDRMDRVIHVGSFNKTLFPNLRLGYLIAPRALQSRLATTLATMERSIGMVEQLGLVAFMKSGDFIRHLRVARQSYQSRRDLLIEQLNKYAGSHHPLTIQYDINPDMHGGYRSCSADQRFPRITGHQAGFHFILWLPKHDHEREFCNAAAQAGISLKPLSLFCHSVSLPPAVLVGYAALTMAQIRYAGRNLGKLLHSRSSRTELISNPPIFDRHQK